MSCSALRRSYRDRLRRHVPHTLFVHLAGPQQVVQRRMDSHRGHFMPRSLLPSQYGSLEPLGADEPGITLDLGQPVPVLVDEYVAWAERRLAHRPSP